MGFGHLHVEECDVAGFVEGVEEGSYFFGGDHSHLCDGFGFEVAFGLEDVADSGTGCSMSIPYYSIHSPSL